MQCLIIDHIKESTSRKSELDWTDLSSIFDDIVVLHATTYEVHTDTISEMVFVPLKWSESQDLS